MTSFNLLKTWIAMAGLALCLGGCATSSKTASTSNSSREPFCQQHFGADSERQWVIYQEPISTGAASRGLAGFRCSVKAEKCVSPSVTDRAGKCQSGKYPLKALCPNGELESVLGKGQLVGSICKDYPASAANAAEPLR